MKEQNKDITPPKYADRFLSWFCRDELLEEVQGDLYEYYLIAREENSRRKADLLYWYHVLHFLRPFAIKRGRQNLNAAIMYKSYFKFAWRNALKHKANTFMHLLSLGLGVACFIFIFVYLKGELSYDKFHQDADRIYRVAIDFVDSERRRLPDATTPPALAPALTKDFPEVAASVRLFPNWGGKFLLGTSPDRKFYEERVIRTDSTFFDVFSFPVLYGDTKTALDNPDQMVITRSAAIKYFGKEDVVGETLTLFDEEKTIYKISAVLEDVPVTSHFKFDFLARIPFQNLEQNWGWYNYYTYMKLASGADIATLEPKLQPFFESYLEEREIYNIIYSQPLTDIHLKSNLKWELEANGDMNNVYIFSMLAIFVLIVSCLNYLNLNVAESFKRFREVGVRKVFGANKRTLVGQFLVGTFLITLAALLLGSVLSEILFKTLGDVIGRKISLLDPENLQLFFGISLVVLLVGIIAGLYPAIHLSSFKAAMAVKGLFNPSGKSVSGLRRSLLVIQFAISTFMIFCSIAVYQQLQFVKNVDKGFSSEQVMVIENVGDIRNQQTLKTELLKINEVSSAGLSNGIIGGLNWTTSLGYPDAFTMNWVVIDPEFIETMGLELIEGRNFSRERPGDTIGVTIIVNETALKELKLTHEDIGKSLPLYEPEDSLDTGRGTVIGVVKDFHFTDFKSTIKPFCFFYRAEPQDYLSLKLSTANVPETLSAIENVWSDFSNQTPLEYFFLDKSFAELYAKESQLSNVLLFLTILALFIAFIGMFAIANMTIKDRTKEIAIRKVLGASVSNVVMLITRNFLWLVVIANLIAAPIAYLTMQRWLEDFAYRTSLGVALFLVTIISTLLVAWATVGFQSFRVAIGNPVKSLKQE
ncbi:MAG: ABC transporter permease [Saprospiraceae bacterium]|nr:MAG: ABC transporter permease [Saprospiraceae bacterium]